MAEPRSHRPARKLRGMPPNIVVTDVIPPSVINAIERGSEGSHSLIASTGDRRPLAVLLNQPKTQRVVGGAIGLSSLGLLFLDAFFLPEQFRGRGLGTMLLREFEEEGRRRGCRTAFLYTISFPEFYAGNGWKVLGRTPYDRPGTFRVFMTKSLKPMLIGPDPLLSAGSPLATTRSSSSVRAASHPNIHLVRLPSPVWKQGLKSKIAASARPGLNPAPMGILPFRKAGHSSAAAGLLERNK
ncbi:GNAT superfamily N-acetyltransferase [Bradyrhizobium sp. USDA 4508]